MQISRSGGARYIICTSGTRPASPAEGTLIYETDTNKAFTYSGTSWVQRMPSMLDTQYIVGAQEAYSGGFAGGPVTYLTTNGSAPLQITYTPTTDAWWEVTLHISIVNKMDAAYHLIYAGIELAPAPVSGNAQRYSGIVQHSGVDTYMSFDKTTIFQLAANTAYTAKSWLGAGNGGTWQYHRGSAHLDMHSKAWAR